MSKVQMMIKNRIRQALLFLCVLCFFANSASAVFKSGTFWWYGDNGYKVRLDFIFEDDFDYVGHWGYHDVRRTISDFYMTTWGPDWKIVQRVSQLGYDYLMFRFDTNAIAIEGGMDVGADPGYFLVALPDNNFALNKATLETGITVDRGQGYTVEVGPVDKSKFPEYNPKMIPDYGSTAFLMLPALTLAIGLRLRRKRMSDSFDINQFNSNLNRTLTL